MPLNVEEKYSQEQFKIRQRNNHRRADEREIADLEEQLRLCRNTNDYINNTLDKKIELLDLVNGECKKLRLLKQDEKEFAENVLKILGWVL